jgi:hypothetical protein
MSSAEPPAPYFEAALDMGNYRWTAHAMFKYDAYKARYKYSHVRFRVGFAEFEWSIGWFPATDIFARRSSHYGMAFLKHGTSNWKPHRHPHHLARILEQLDIIVPAVHNLTA